MIYVVAITMALNCLPLIGVRSDDIITDGHMHYASCAVTITMALLSSMVRSDDIITDGYYLRMPLALRIMR